MKVYLQIGCACLGLTVGAFANRTSVNVAGDGPLGDFTGTMSYQVLDPQYGTLEFNLTNTSPPENGGFMTSFVFNIPDEASFHGFYFESAAPGADFHAIVDDGTKSSPTKAVPYGTFDLGASATGEFLGGGNPSTGLPVGESGLFSFSLWGTGMDLLTADSFVEAGASMAKFEDGEYFVSRFRGFDDGGSNKTGGGAVPDTSSSILLLGMSLAGMLGVRRMRPSHCAP